MEMPTPAAAASSDQAQGPEAATPASSPVEISQSVEVQPETTATAATSASSAEPSVDAETIASSLESLVAASVASIAPSVGSSAAALPPTNLEHTDVGVLAEVSDSSSSTTTETPTEAMAEAVPDVHTTASSESPEALLPTAALAFETPLAEAAAPLLKEEAPKDAAVLNALLGALVAADSDDAEAKSATQVVEPLEATTETTSSSFVPTDFLSTTPLPDPTNDLATSSTKEPSQTTEPAIVDAFFAMDSNATNVVPPTGGVADFEGLGQSQASEPLDQASSLDLSTLVEPHALASSEQPVAQESSSPDLLSGSPFESLQSSSSHEAVSTNPPTNDSHDPLRFHILSAPFEPPDPEARPAAVATPLDFPSTHLEAAAPLSSLPAHEDSSASLPTHNQEASTAHSASSAAPAHHEEVPAAHEQATPPKHEASAPTDHGEASTAASHEESSHHEDEEELQEMLRAAAEAEAEAQKALKELEEAED